MSVHVESLKTQRVHIHEIESEQIVRAHALGHLNFDLCVPWPRKIEAKI